ncbi:hypothetical protein PspLS_07817 [Pyricularia sp. CBS 133598]|nr:hypothetical protein PspLS_07817 [Pyricularia sp. CBS 133598]
MWMGSRGSRYAVVTDGRLETKKWPRTPWSNLPIQGVGGPSKTQGGRWADPAVVVVTLVGSGNVQQDKGHLNKPGRM